MVSICAMKQSDGPYREAGVSIFGDREIRGFSRTNNVGNTIGAGSDAFRLIVAQGAV